MSSRITIFKRFHCWYQTSSKISTQIICRLSGCGLLLTREFDFWIEPLALVSLLCLVSYTFCSLISCPSFKKFNFQSDCCPFFFALLLLLVLLGLALCSRVINYLDRPIAPILQDIFASPFGIRGCISLDRRLVRDPPEQGCELYFEGFNFFHHVDVTRKTVPETWANSS